MYVFAHLLLLEIMCLYLMNLIDWKNDFLEYAICSIAYHLEQSSPSADLKDYLQQFSFEHLIENLRKYYNFFIQQQDSRSLRTVMFWIQGFMWSFWEFFFDFVPAMKTLVCPCIISLYFIAKF